MRECHSKLQGLKPMERQTYTEERTNNQLPNIKKQPMFPQYKLGYKIAAQQTLKNIKYLNIITQVRKHIYTKKRTAVEEHCDWGNRAGSPDTKLVPCTTCLR